MSTRPRFAPNRWCLRLACGVLALGLAACQPDGRTDAASVPSPEVLARLDALDPDLRLRPREIDDELRELSAQQPPGSASRLAVLGLRAVVLARVDEAARYEDLREQLAQWPGREDPRVATTLRLTEAVMEARRAALSNQGQKFRKILTILDEIDETGQPQRLLLTLWEMRAGVFTEQGEFDKALRAGHRVLELADGPIATLTRRVYARLQLAAIYAAAQQFDQAVKTQAEAEQLAAGDKRPLLRYFVAVNRGSIYQDRDRAITEAASQVALEAARETGFDDLIANALANRADDFLRKKEWASAIALTTEAVRLAQKRNDVYAAALGRHNLGIALMHTGQVAQGRQEIEAGFKQAAEAGAATGMDALYEEYGRALQEVGLTQDAVQAYLKERQFRRQLYRDDLRKTVLEAQEALEADRRSREIELLNRDMSLKNEQLRASQLEFRLWLLMGGCVLAAGVLMLMAYRRVRRTNMALQSTNERLKVQSERDPLTGLANRRHFQAAIRQREEQDLLRGSVFLIDIDHFKRVNDRFGHAAGDTVLVEVSRRLRQALREDDLVVRWGGEEFLIVIKSCDPVFAQHLGQRLLEAIGGQPVTHERHTVPVTASIGFASLPIEPHGVSLHWERAIDMVDTLMYMAKAHGRNKAYGLQWADATDGDGLVALSEQMEAAWHDGKVRLSTPAGPAQWTEPRP